MNQGLISGALNALGTLAAPRGSRGRLVILIYHRVLDKIDEMVPGTLDARAFDWQMATLSRHCNVLRLSDAIARSRSGSLPSRAAAVTFDDGYEDNARVALPILQRHQVPACFFVATGFLDGGMMWNDVIIEAVRRAPPGVLNLEGARLPPVTITDLRSRSAALEYIIGRLKHLSPEERRAGAEAVRRAAGARLDGLSLMMRSADVRALHAAGMEIGGHTVTHPILARIGDDEARTEIIDGKRRLEEITGAPVELFAYPNGKPGQDYTDAHVRMVRELGFQAAMSTVWGSASAGIDPYQLPRFTPWDRTPGRFILRLFRNYRRSPEGLLRNQGAG